MKKCDVMCLNNKIKGYLNNTPVCVERLDKEGFRCMLEELREEELTLLTFTALADIFKADYKFTIITNKNNNIYMYEITNEDDTIVWNQIDRIYKAVTGKQLYSATLCYRELIEEFAKINGKIIFE